MLSICRLKNPIQPYAWGSRTALAKLLGNPVPAPVPQAEMWMGAHPKAPSIAQCGTEWVPLSELIMNDPLNMLGKRVSERFDSKLPFLFKVIAAESPLSIQAHPDREKAEQGYIREEEMKIPKGAPERNYKDRNHKPECLCALGRFVILKGFLRQEQILKNISLACPFSLRDLISLLEDFPEPEGIRRFFESLISLEGDEKSSVIDEAVEKIGGFFSEDGVSRWVMRLCDLFPDDMAALSPLFMNLIELRPKEAVFIGAGEPHAYLEGFGIELMANSDNVLRGGLTAKHIDKKELLNVLKFDYVPVELTERKEYRKNEHLYPTPAEEFLLSEVRVTKDSPYSSPKERNIEILLCTKGKGTIVDMSTRKRFAFKKGESFVVPAAVRQYKVLGSAEIFKAQVQEY